MPSLLRMLARWLSTVLMLRTSVAAISLELCPSAISLSTSSSRRLENRYDGTHQTQQPIAIGEKFSARVQLSAPKPGDESPQGSVPDRSECSPECRET